MSLVAAKDFVTREHEYLVAYRKYQDEAQAKFRHTHEDGKCQGLIDGCKTPRCRFGKAPTWGPDDLLCSDCGDSANLHPIDDDETTTLATVHEESAHFGSDDIRHTRALPNSEHWLFGHGPQDICPGFKHPDLKNPGDEPGGDWNWEELTKAYDELRKEQVS